MKNKIILAAAVIFMMSNVTLPQVKVAFVDSEAIIKQLPEAQAVQKQVEELQKIYVDTLTTKENEYKAKAEVLKTKYEEAQKQLQEGKITPEQARVLDNEISAMQTELQRLEQEYAEYKQNVQQTLLAKQAELFKPVNEKITKVIELVAKELKYNFVLDKAGAAVLYGDKELDITFKVLDKLK